MRDRRTAAGPPDVRSRRGRHGGRGPSSRASSDESSTSSPNTRRSDGHRGESSPQHRLRRRVLPHAVHHAADEAGIEVVERRDHHLGGTAPIAAERDDEVTGAVMADPDRHVLVGRVGGEVDHPVDGLEAAPRPAGDVGCHGPATVGDPLRSGPSRTCETHPMGDMDMTLEERDAFLADLHVGILSFDRKGLGPLTLPIWYLYEDGQVLMGMSGDSVKATLLRAAGRATLTVQTETRRTSTSWSPGRSRSTTRRDDLTMATRYLGPELGRGTRTATRARTPGARPLASRSAGSPARLREDATLTPFMPTRSRPRRSHPRQGNGSTTAARPGSAVPGDGDAHARSTRLAASSTAIGTALALKRRLIDEVPTMWWLATRTLPMPPLVSSTTRRPRCSGCVIGPSGDPLVRRRADGAGGPRRPPADRGRAGSSRPASSASPPTGRSVTSSACRSPRCAPSRTTSASLP